MIASSQTPKKTPKHAARHWPAPGLAGHQSERVFAALAWGPSMAKKTSKTMHISIQGPDRGFIGEIEQMAATKSSVDPKAQAEQIQRLAQFSVELAKWCQGLEDAFKVIAENVTFNGK